MKKLSAFLLLCCVATFQKVSAQNVDDRIVKQGTSHFYLGYGAPNGPKKLFSQDGMPNVSMSTSSFGPITATYQYAVAKGFTVGAQFNYSSAKATLSLGDPYGMGGASMQFTQAARLYNIDVRSDYHYLRSSKFDIYTGVILGYGNLGLKMEGTPNMAFDMSYSSGGFAIGAHSGLRYMFTKNIGLFAEGTYQVFTGNLLDLNRVMATPMFNGGISFATNAKKKVTAPTPVN